MLHIGARPYLRVWRQNVGTARSMDGKRVVAFGIKGAADLSGILACGTRLELEVKAKKGRMREAQKSFRAMILRFGGLYFVARSTEEADLALESHLGSCKVCRSLSTPSV